MIRSPLSWCYRGYFPQELKKDLLWGRVGVSDLTFGFAFLLHQQFDNAQEAFGCSQVKWTVAYLATHILICPKLQQQLCNLNKRETGSVKAKSQQGRRWRVMAFTCSWP